MNAPVSTNNVDRRERISIRRRTKAPASATASAADEALQRLLDSHQRQRTGLGPSTGRQAKHTGGPRRSGRKGSWFVLSSLIRFIPGFYSGG